MLQDHTESGSSTSRGGYIRFLPESCDGLETETIHGTPEGGRQIIRILDMSVCPYNVDVHHFSLLWRW